MDSRTMLESGESHVPKHDSEALIARIRYQKENERLDLSLCNLKTVPLEYIDNYYGEPTILDLSYNSIRYLSPQFTMNMSKLTRLDLSRNDLRRLPDNFGEITELVYLDLHGNRLETLPVSMGKMTRLQYLNVSENAFRAPLSSFLGEKSNGHSHDIPGVVVADYVTTFLREILVKMQTEETGTYASRKESDRLLRQRSSKIHYRTRSANLDVDVENTSSGGEGDRGLDVNNNTIDKEREMRMKNIWATLTILALVLFLPILVAYMVETTFLDQLAVKNPQFKSFWTYYKMLHEPAACLTSYIPKNPWQIKGHKPVHKEISSFFSTIPNSITSWCSHAWKTITNLFH